MTAMRNISELPLYLQYRAVPLLSQIIKTVIFLLLSLHITECFSMLTEHSIIKGLSCIKNRIIHVYEFVHIKIYSNLRIILTALHVLQKIGKSKYVLTALK